MFFQKIRDYLEFINLYGLDFNVLYKKERTYSTIFDIFLSFLFLILLIVVSIIYFSELFYHKGFNLVTNLIELKEKQTINLSNCHLFFGLSYFTGEFIQLDPTYLDFQIIKIQHDILEYPNRSKYEIHIEKEIKYQICQLNDTFNFDNGNVNNFLCIPDNQNLTIAGEFGNRILGYDTIDIHFKKCTNNSKSEIICHSEKEINQYISNIMINLIYLSYSIDHYDINEPIKTSLKHDFFLPSSTLYKRYNYFFQFSEYKSDNGFVTKREKNYQFYQYDSLITEFNDKEINEEFSSSFLEIAFSVKSFKKEINRSYIKLQDVLGNIGGCTDLIFRILQLISLYFSEKSFLIEFSSSLVNGPMLCPDNREMLKKAHRKIEFINNNAEKNKSEKLRKLTLNSSFSINNRKDGTYINFIPQKEKKANNFISKLNSFIDDNNSKNDKISSSKYKIEFCNCYKKQLKYNILDYCIPFFVLEKFNHKDIIKVYENMFKKYLSVEVFIPILERINHSFELEFQGNYYFKVDSFLKKTKTNII